VVLFDGSVGSAVVGLGCDVTERRGAAVDSAASVRECAGYSSGGMKKRGELQRVASKGDAADCMVGGARGAAATRGTGSGGAVGTARSEQRRLDALSRGARSEDAGVV
jgi:hypothetical protein